MPNPRTVSSTKFQQAVGNYIEQAAKQPVVITKHNRPARVLLDFEEYERLKRYDTRRSLYPHELDDDLADQLKAAEFDEGLDDLGRLME